MLHPPLKLMIIIIPVLFSLQYMNKKHGSNVPLVLMNSFNTHSDTERIRFKYERRVDLHMFQQSYYPRVLKETLRPYPEKIDLQDGRYGREEGEERGEKGFVNIVTFIMYMRVQFGYY